MSEPTGAVRVLLEALDALPDPAWCEGTAPVADLTITLPGAGQRAQGDRDLVAWLVAHAEIAPYGDATGTRVDRRVRDVLRVTARGAAAIAGLDLAPVLAAVERALASDCRLVAELLDILVYEPGSKFVSHKDTPRHDDQLGTLVIGLPTLHRGGALKLVDGERTATIDWSDPADPEQVRWLAMFGDVDHEIERLTNGVRVTAVYRLRYRTDERLEPAQRDAMDTLIDAAIGLHDALSPGDRLAIPCSRMIVARRDAEHPLPHDVLRGADRLIAAALERGGITVSVRECIVVADDEETPFVEAAVEAQGYGRVVLLARSMPDSVISGANALSWDDEADADDPDVSVAALAEYVAPDEFPRCEWVVRERARARMSGESMMYSHSGYFGNEYSTYHVYRFALMFAEVK